MLVVIKRIVDHIDSFSDRSGQVVSVLAYGMLASLLIEVLLRYIFNEPTIWAHEVGAYLFGAYFMLGGAYCLRHKGHVAVDILYIRLSRRKQAVLDVITFSLFLSVCITLLWYGGVLAKDSWRIFEHSNSTFGPPIYPIKTVIPIAGGLLLIQGLAKFVRDLVIVVTGKELGEI